ncbi:hypothetical protein DFH07DRAFT_832893 [Mycena maculata]|uniref:BTB domain-containing protein n=1 Tax=Mycena maculata TaxID=230809 RepID=A0AAD7INV1_9AGAR|nr:hypothetical protein DFH07DRAFT_832893 [Mycena maculata]
MSDDTTHIRDAGAPFSPSPHPHYPHCHPFPPADFILRSSDGVDFHVHQDILKFSSTCFDGMFTAVRNGTSNLSRDWKPVILLPEPHPVLRLLLTLAYPAVLVSQYSLTQADLDVFVDTYKAAGEYRFMNVQQLLDQMLDNSSLIEAHPHRLFAIGRICDVHSVVRKAALCTLRSTLHPRLAAFPEMRRLSWDEAQKLPVFHHMCGINAEKIVKGNAKSPREVFRVGDADERGYLYPQIQNTETTETFVWWSLGKHSKKCVSRCVKIESKKISRGDVRATPLSWFRDHMAIVAHRALSAPSHDLVKVEVLNITPATRTIIDSCAICSEYADSDLANFAGHLATDIEDTNNLLVMKFCHDRV